MDSRTLHVQVFRISLRCFETQRSVSFEGAPITKSLKVCSSAYLAPAPSLPLLLEAQRDETCKKGKKKKGRQQCFCLSEHSFLRDPGFKVVSRLLNVSSSDDNEWLMLLRAFIISYCCCFVTHHPFTSAWNSQLLYWWHNLERSVPCSLRKDT